MVHDADRCYDPSCTAYPRALDGEGGAISSSLERIDRERVQVGYLFVVFGEYFLAGPVAVDELKKFRFQARTLPP